MPADDKKPRSFRYRKDTVFRIYLFAFCAFFAGSSLFLISAQSRFYKREIVALRSQLQDVSAEVSKINSVSCDRAKSDGDSSFDRSSSQRPADAFFVEGTGTNRKWFYIDVCFNDGYRARYYLPARPSRRDLVGLHRRLTHDSVVHFYVPLDTDAEM